MNLLIIGLLCKFWVSG